MLEQIHPPLQAQNPRQSLGPCWIQASLMPS